MLKGMEMKFMSKGAPHGEIVFITNNASSAAKMAMYRSKKIGDAIRLAQGLYVVGTTMSTKDVVKHHLYNIVALYWPGGVLVGKSALSPSLQDGDELFISSPNPNRSTPLALAGVTIIPVTGPGALPGDIPLPNNIFLSSDARRLVENVNLKGKPAKWRAGNEKVEDAIDGFLGAGTEKIRSILNDLDVIESHFDPVAILFVKKTLVSLLGTTNGRKLTPTSARLVARLGSAPFDSLRIDSLKRLVGLLETRAPEPKPSFSPASRWEWLPFFESYFSNFIEGTEFDIDEAFKIAIEGFISPTRPADSHDISASYRIISDSKDQIRVPESGIELIAILQDRHARMMAARPEVAPGVFKTVPNRVGTYYFVQPNLIEGTLLAGFDAMRQLEDPMTRSVAMTALITECHPFVDGNGRISRMMENSELSARSEVRIVIPTISRSNYLQALRAYSDPGNGGNALISVMRHAQKWSAALDWTDYQSTKETLGRLNAFEITEAAEAKNLKLGFPGTT
jgi:hypothetical protein